MAFYSGLACRPADINLPFDVFLCPRDSNPGWGIGVARLVAGAVFCVVGCLLGQDFVSAFACNATGLDAVQRLEQKNIVGFTTLVSVVPDRH